MPFGTISFEVDHDIARIELARPEVHNAYNMEMRDDLHQVFTACALNTDLRAVFISGRGDSFCSGADLTEFGTAPSPLDGYRIRFRRDVWAALAAIPAPTFALLHGNVIGSGIEMALLCDLRIAHPSTRIILPEAALGLIPAATGTQTIPRAVGVNRASEILLTGAPVGADAALALGLIDRISDEAETVALATVESWQLIPRGRLVETKRALQRGRTGPWRSPSRGGEAGHRSRYTGSPTEALA